MPLRVSAKLMFGPHVKITPLGKQLAARERLLRCLQGNLIT
jgi:hypothetical protein